jgi:hypothetical protein
MYYMIKLKENKGRVIIFLLIIIVLIPVSKTLLLYNDEAVTNKLLENPYMKDFEVVKLKRVTDGHSIVNNIMERDLNGTRIRNYGFMVRVFEAWKHPRGSVDEDENWVVFGFIDWNNHVFIGYITRESELRPTI